MQLLGTLNSEDATTVMKLFNRKYALIELLQSLSGKVQKDDPVLQHIVADFALTKQKIAEWWVNTAQKYNWKYNSSSSWRIDFETNSVYLY